MNVASERAREACESCRKSHKKCQYDDNSKRCLRCEGRNTPCSLFLSVETSTAVAQQGPPALVTAESSDSWDGNPHDSAVSSNFSYQFPPQEDHQWTAAVFSATPQEEYPADMIFQTFANQHESEQPMMNQDGLYHSNVLGAS